MSPQALAALLILVVMASGAGVLYSVIPGMRLDNALEELVMLSNKASRAGGKIPRLFTNFQKGVDNGYLPKDYKDGSGANKFGNTITASAAAATGVVTMTYVTDDAAQCKFLAAEAVGRVFKLSSAACATTTLTLVIDPMRS